MKPKVKFVSAHVYIKIESYTGVDQVCIVCPIQGDGSGPECMWMN